MKLNRFEFYVIADGPVVNIEIDTDSLNGVKTKAKEKAKEILEIMGHKGQVHIQKWREFPFHTPKENFIIFCSFTLDKQHG